MFIEERHKAIVDGLAKRMRMTMEEIQVLAKASAATVRRDLEQLDAEGRIVRVHGGAVFPGYLDGEPTFTEKSREAVLAKAAIAGRVADLVTPGSAVFVDSGTTCLEVGKRLLPRKDVTIYTNSVPLIGAPGSRAARLVGIGGEVRDVSRALVGALSLSWLNHVRFDIAVIGASGLSAKEGLSTTELSEASVKQQLVQRSATRILAADSTKWGKPRSISFAGWEDVHHWVTDRAIPRDAVTFATDRRVRVEIVGEKK